MQRLHTGQILLNCSEISRQKGFLAMESCLNKIEDKKNLRKDILAFYSEKEQKLETANLLEELVDYDDVEIQHIIRYIDNATFIAALSGSSNKVCVKFLSNLSDRLLYFIDVDIKQYQGSEEEIIEAQQRILKIAENILQKQQL